MNDALMKIKSWLEKNNSNREFNDPASKDSIHRIGTELNLDVPEEIREYLMTFNGESYLSPGIIGNWRLLEVDDIVSKAKKMHEFVNEGIINNNQNNPTPYIKGYWWNDSWIPIAASENGNLICVDLDPNDRGMVGQVILYLHDSASRYLVAKSLSGWFAQIAEDLEKGTYQLIDDDGFMTFNNEAFMWSSWEGKHIFG